MKKEIDALLSKLGFVRLKSGIYKMKRPDGGDIEINPSDDCDVIDVVKLIIGEYEEKLSETEYGDDWRYIW